MCFLKVINSKILRFLYPAGQPVNRVIMDMKRNGGENDVIFWIGKYAMDLTKKE